MLEAQVGKKILLSTSQPLLLGCHLPPLLGFSIAVAGLLTCLPHLVVAADAVVEQEIRISYASHMLYLDLQINKSTN
jgi:branched-subunit amino acid permease